MQSEFYLTIDLRNFSLSSRFDKLCHLFALKELALWAEKPNGPLFYDASSSELCEVVGFDIVDKQAMFKGHLNRVEIRFKMSKVYAVDGNGNPPSLKYLESIKHNFGYTLESMLLPGGNQKDIELVRSLCSTDVPKITI